MYRALRLTALAALIPSLFALPATAQGYGVRPGDQVVIDFFTAAGEEIQEIAGDRTVDGEGNLFLPYVGSVPVEGRDAVGIRELLNRLYANLYPEAVIDVEVSMRVSVTGSVRTPNVYYLDPTTTLLQALAHAGGEGFVQGVAASQFSRGIPDLTQVRLVRGDSTLVINLSADNEHIEEVNRPIESGDWLYVPTVRSAFSLRENVTFWGSVVSLVATVAFLVNQLGG